MSPSFIHPTRPWAFAALGAWALQCLAACAGPAATTARGTLVSERPQQLEARSAPTPSASAMPRVPGTDPVLDALENPHLPASARIAALREFQARGGPPVVEVIQPLLSSDDPAVREAAAAALGNFNGQEARKQLEAQLEREEDLRVREELQHSLTKLEP